MAWYFKPIEWAWWFLKSVRGSASLEHGMVAGTAVVVATTMAAGLGSAGVDSSRQSQAQVTQSVAASQTNLVTVGAVSLESATTTAAAADTTVVRDNGEVTLAAGETVRAVNYVYFHVRNPGDQAYDLANLHITYGDDTQEADLHDPSNAVTLDETGLIVTAGQMTFTFLTGSPMPAQSADGVKGSPTIKAGDLVEIKADLTALSKRLTSNSRFSIEMQPADGLAFTLEKTSPQELYDSNTLN